MDCLMPYNLGGGRRRDDSGESVVVGWCGVEEGAAPITSQSGPTPRAAPAEMNSGNPGKENPPLPKSIDGTEASW